MRTILTVIMLLLLTTPAWSATYHVACETGSDTNTGGSGDPFLTLQKASDTAVSGDTVIVTASEPCRITTAFDTKANGVTYTSDSAPTKWRLRGSELFASGWTDEGGSVWSHSLSTDPGVMVTFDEVLQAAWIEDGTCPTALDTDNEFCVSGSTLYVQSATNPASRWTSPGVEVVQGLAEASSTFNTMLMHLSHNNTVVEHVDAMHAGNTLIQIAGDNITLQDFRVGFSVHDANRSCANNMPCTDGRQVVAIAAGADNGTMRRGVIHNAGRDGFNFSATGGNNTWLIEDVEIYNAFNHGATGVIGSTGTITNVTMRNLYLHDVCGFIGYANSAADKQIVSLTVERSWGTAQVKSGDARVKSYWSCGAAANDAFIRDNGSTAASTVIVRNNILGPDIDLGIYTEGLSNDANYTIEQNLIYGILNFGIDFSRIDPMTAVQDNIVTATGGTGPFADFLVGCLNSTDCPDFTSRSFAAFDHNLYDPNAGTDVGFIAGTGGRTLAQWRTDTGADANSLEADPLLVDPNNDDFHLAAASPAIGAGSTGDDIGPFATLPTVSSCEVGNVADDVVVVTWTDPTWGGVGIVDNSAFDIELDGNDVTESNTIIQSTSETRTTLSADVTSEQTVVVKLARGAVESVEGIGVSSNLLRAVSRANTTGVECSNNATAIAAVTGMKGSVSASGSASIQ